MIVQLANFIDLVENNRFEYINSFYTLAIDYFKLILHYEINHRIYIYIIYCYFIINIIATPGIITKMEEYIPYMRKYLKTELEQRIKIYYSTKMFIDLNICDNEEKYVEFLLLFKKYMTGYRKKDTLNYLKDLELYVDYREAIESQIAEYL